MSGRWIIKRPCSSRCDYQLCIRPFWSSFYAQLLCLTGVAISGGLVYRDMGIGQTGVPCMFLVNLMKSERLVTDPVLPKTRRWECLATFSQLPLVSTESQQSRSDAPFRPSGFCEYTRALSQLLCISEVSCSPRDVWKCWTCL